MILTVYTPITCTRSHTRMYVQRSSNIMFGNSTAALDRHNSSVFLFSTATPIGALPLAAVVTSNEQEESITQAMEMLKSILLQHAFFEKALKKSHL